MMSLFQRAARVMLCMLGLFFFCTNAFAANYADFRADIEYKKDGSAARHCGSAISSGRYARMDAVLDKSGTFSFILDTQRNMLLVLSYNLNAYVEIPVPSNERSWRGMVQSVAASVMQQSMGMVSLQEKEYKALGKGSWQGYPVKKSRAVFEGGFMGKLNRFTLEVWENDAFSPFPMRVAAQETRHTHAAEAYLTNIVAEQSSPAVFEVPNNFTRCDSMLDFVLYALTAF